MFYYRVDEFSPYPKKDVILLRYIDEGTKLSSLHSPWIRLQGGIIPENIDTFLIPIRDLSFDKFEFQFSLLRIPGHIKNILFTYEPLTWKNYLQGSFLPPFPSQNQLTSFFKAILNRDIPFISLDVTEEPNFEERFNLYQSILNSRVGDRLILEEHTNAPFALSVFSKYIEEMKRLSQTALGFCPLYGIDEQRKIKLRRSAKKHKYKEPKSGMRCPVSSWVMQNPVFLPDGRNIEFAVAKKHFRERRENPFGGNITVEFDEYYRPNLYLKEEIKKYLTMYPPHFPEINLSSTLFIGDDELLEKLEECFCNGVDINKSFGSLRVRSLDLRLEVVWTVLVGSIRHNNIQLTRQFLEWGASFEEHGINEYLHFVLCNFCDRQMLELLFKFEYEIPDLDIALANAFFPGLNLSEGATYFHLCAGLGNIEILEYFHEIHPDSLLNAIDNMGNTPLHVAVKCKQIDSVEWLLEQTLSPWMINHNDFSPIDISNELGHKAISKVLIQNARFERIEKNQFINTLESEIQTLENTLSGQSETLIDNQNLRVRVSALESFEKKYSEISETLIESTNRITELESIISDIEEKRSQKESELLSMTNAWLDKKEAVNLKEEEILKMNQSIEELVSLLQSANECLTRMRENEQQLLQITEKAEAAFEGAERRYRKIESDLIETEKQVQAWESQVLDLRSQLNQRKANKEIVRLKYELAEQSGEAEQLKIENKDLLANNTHFRREKVEAESLLSESDQKNKALQGDLAKLTEYMKALGYNPEEILESNVDKMKIRPRTSTLFQ